MDTENDAQPVIKKGKGFIKNLAGRCSSEACKGTVKAAKPIKPPTSQPIIVERNIKYVVPYLFNSNDIYAAGFASRADAEGFAKTDAGIQRWKQDYPDDRIIGMVIEIKTTTDNGKGKISWVGA